MLFILQIHVLNSTLYSSQLEEVNRKLYSVTYPNSPVPECRYRHSRILVLFLGYTEIILTVISLGLLSLVGISISSIEPIVPAVCPKP